MSVARNIIAMRNRVIRRIAEQHSEGLAYESDRWRTSMAYWIVQARKVASS